jgi:phosphatidate cytidylyltransferase
MLKRIIVGLLLTAMAIGLFLLDGIYLKIAVILIELATEHELIKTLNEHGKKFPGFLVYILTAVSLPVMELTADPGMQYVLTGIVLCAMFSICIIRKDYGYESMLSSALSVAYPFLFFTFLNLMLINPNRQFAIAMMVTSLASALLSDTFAYFFGSFFGRHKLIERVSPKKSVEGAVAGIAGGVIGTIAATLIMKLPVSTADIAVLGIAGAFLSIISQFGDLTASVIKRHFEIKDYSSVLPGHGGFLDRLDSTLFVLPFVYFLYKLYFKI